MVPLISCFAETAMVDRPPQGMSLCTESETSVWPTLKAASLDTYRLT